MPTPIVGAIGASIGGSVIQKSAADKATKAQTRAGREQLALQERIYDESVARTEPWTQTGHLANNALAYMAGLGDAPMIGGTAPQIETITNPGTYSPSTATGPGSFGGSGGGSYGAPTTKYRVGGQDFATMEEAQAWANANKTGGTEWSWQTDPGYQFRLQEGQSALEAGAAARGGLYSGAAMQDLLKLGQDYGSQEWGNIWNRLSGLSGTGLSAASGGNAAGQNFANGASNALGAIGNAQAAGAIGGANAINSGIGNALGVWNYQNQMNSGSGSGGSNWLWGNSWS